MNHIGIDIHNLCLSFGKKVLYDDLNFSLAAGDKVTIVGENGCGKTTLLRLLSGKEKSYSASSFEVEGNLGYLAQHFEEINGETPSLLTLLQSTDIEELIQFASQSQHRLMSEEWVQELGTLGESTLIKVFMMFRGI